MSLRSNGRIFESGQARTLYVSIPSEVATDSSFPFEKGEDVTVSIHDGELRVTSDDEESELDTDRRNSYNSSRDFPPIPVRLLDPNNEAHSLHIASRTGDFSPILPVQILQLRRSLRRDRTNFRTCRGQVVVSRIPT